MPTERIALVSDVHGNLTAYRAVLADLATRGLTRVINLGDVAGKGPRGAACCALTRERCEVTVRGNWDSMLGSSDSPGLEWPPARWWQSELTVEDREWLAGLTNSHDLLLGGRRIRLVHASATSEFVRVHFHHTAEEFAAMFASTDFTGPGPTPELVAYGDIHDTYVEVDDGRTLLNAGSVGNPLDEPTAAYVIIEGSTGADGPTTAGPFMISIVRVPYDIEAEIAVAYAADMPTADTYAIELRTAVYRGLHDERGLTVDR